LRAVDADSLRKRREQFTRRVEYWSAERLADDLLRIIGYRSSSG
jgi:hypothetical protein